MNHNNVTLKDFQVNYQNRQESTRMAITGVTIAEYIERLNSAGMETAPKWAKVAAFRICDAYGIKGVCDPGYIANVINNAAMGKEG